jgi:hypothetical protein
MSDVRDALRVVLWGGFLLTFGCAAATYEPTRPLRARVADPDVDVDIQLERLRFGSEAEVIFAVRAGKPHVIRHAWLTVPDRSLCTGGKDAVRVVVDDRTGQDDFLPTGSHQLRLAFPAPATDLDLNLVADLAFTDGGCVRTPVVSQSFPFTATRARFAIVGSTGIDGNSSLDGLKAIYSFSLGAGLWAGPMLLSAEVGVAEAMCETETCGVREGTQGALRTGVTFPVSVGVRYPLWANFYGPTHMMLVPTIGARYLFAPIDLPGLDGHHRFAVHGLEAIFAVASSMTTTGPGPFLHGERTPSMEVLVPIGVMLAPAARGDRVAFTAGLSVRAFFHL